MFNRLKPPAVSALTTSWLQQWHWGFWWITLSISLSDETNKTPVFVWTSDRRVSLGSLCFCHNTHMLLQRLPCWMCCRLHSHGSHHWSNTPPIRGRQPSRSGCSRVPNRPGQAGLTHRDTPSTGLPTRTALQYYSFYRQEQYKCSWNRFWISCDFVSNTNKNRFATELCLLTTVFQSVPELT